MVCEVREMADELNLRFVGLLAGIIPIYWGHEDVLKYFNPERFIRCDIPVSALGT